jgi:hypothetical protein
MTSELTAQSVEPGWPEGGHVAGDWLACAGCSDEIWPSERVYPAGADPAAGVLCAVCEVDRVRAAEQREKDTRPYPTGGDLHGA